MRLSRRRRRDGNRAPSAATRRAQDAGCLQPRRSSSRNTQTLSLQHVPTSPRLAPSPRLSPFTRLCLYVHRVSPTQDLSGVFGGCALICRLCRCTSGTSADSMSRDDAMCVICKSFDYWSLSVNTQSRQSGRDQYAHALGCIHS